MADEEQAHTSSVTRGEDQAESEAEGTEREGKRPAGSVNEEGSIDQEDDVKSSGTVDMPPA
ncbi:MAG: hypothetical protein M3Y36_03615 [Actinomycetota bacterium]|nr:hypothetical protein [Actinomycetota bacterium]